MERRQRVLLVDDDRTYLSMLHKVLSPEFDVVIANFPEEAIRFLKAETFDAMLVDVVLGIEDGIRLGKKLRHIDPQMAIILMTSSYKNYRNSGLGFDDYLVKGKTLIYTGDIINNAIYQKNMPRDIRVRRLDLLGEFLPECKDVFREFYREVSGDPKLGVVDKLVGTLCDGNQISWSNYDRKGTDKRVFNMAIATSIGCGRGCKFCLHRDHGLLRLLDRNEMLGQALYCLDSFHAKGLFEIPRLVKPRINFTGCGETMYNLLNVMETIIGCSRVEELGFEFILTSAGIPSKLEEFINRKYVDIAGILHYWSVNSCIAKMRDMLMPSDRFFDLMEIHKLYNRIARITGSPVTASFVFIPGMNDTPEDAKRIIDLFGDKELWKVKIQPYTCPEEKYRVFGTATPKEIEDFTGLLGNDVDWRVRQIVGENFSGCGSNVPDSFLKCMERV